MMQYVQFQQKHTRYIAFWSIHSDTLQKHEQSESLVTT